MPDGILGAKQPEFGDISERLELRKRLNCNSFRWYLENIYPESQMPLDYLTLGEVRNKETGQCLDTMGRKAGEKVGMVTCHGLGGNQVFTYSKRRTLQSDDLCLDVSSLSGPVKLYQCHFLGGNQLWEYDNKKMTIRHMSSNQCLDKPLPHSQDTPSMATCNDAESQRWIFGELNWRNENSS